MTPDNEQHEKEFFCALQTKKTEEFWRTQRAAIMESLPSRKAAQIRLVGWKLAPAVAMLAIAVAWLFNHEKTIPPPQTDAQMLENIGLLDEMDLLERIPEKELI